MNLKEYPPNSQVKSKNKKCTEIDTYIFAQKESACTSVYTFMVYTALLSRTVI